MSGSYTFNQPRFSPRLASQSLLEFRLPGRSRRRCDCAIGPCPATVLQQSPKSYICKLRWLANCSRNGAAALASSRQGSLAHRPSGRPQQHVICPEACLPLRSRLVPCYSAIPQRVGSSDGADVALKPEAETAWRWFYAFFKFSRPHTVLGTFISVVSVSLLAVGPQDIGWRSLRGLLQALVPALLMNVHIVGLNQIFDVKIDKVNKPYLPLASGEFSMQTAIAIVSVCGAMALLMGILVGSLPLLVTLVGSAVLGCFYSVDLPFLRWKQYPIASAACILAVRGVLVQLGFFFHMKQVLGSTDLVVTPPVAFTTCFMLLFAIVIALFKDIPDVRGDSQAGVRTLSVRRGTSQVFWTCICLLELAYTGAIVAGFTSKILWSRIATVVAHLAMGTALFLRARKTDLHQSKSIYSCYMYVWKLFYAEYLFIPLLR